MTEYHLYHNFSDMLSLRHITESLLHFGLVEYSCFEWTDCSGFDARREHICNRLPISVAFLKQRIQEYAVKTDVLQEYRHA